MEKDYLDTLPVIKKLKPIEANFEAILKPFRSRAEVFSFP